MIEMISQFQLENTFFESVSQGITLRPDCIYRPADANSYLVFSRGPNHNHAYFVGPWAGTTQLQYESDAEIVWVRLRFGTSLKRISAMNFSNKEYLLSPDFSGDFMLNGQVFHRPISNDVDGLLDNLTRAGIFSFDPIVSEVLETRKSSIPDRTLRNRFLTSVGISRERVIQIKRVQKAALLISQGNSIVDVALNLGFYDQSHLTKAFKQFIGSTPGEYIRH